MILSTRSMNSVLMIAYGFPPEGHAGVFRPLRFARNLPRFGWNVTVVSAGGVQYHRYDPALLASVPPGTEVIRPVATDDLWQRIQRRRAHRRATVDSHAGAHTQADAPVSIREHSLRSGIRTLIRKAESCWYHPDMEVRWIAPAVDAAVDACSRHRPDALWATGPPWSAFLVAARVSERTGVPYVLDFRTSWTIVPSTFEEMRPAWAHRRDRRLLRKLLSHAQGVTFFYEAEAECFWRRYGGALDVSRIHIIPNGFDGEVDDSPLPVADTFRILYTGTLSDYRYDTFLEALALFRKSDPSRSRQLLVEFVGEEQAPLVSRVRELGLSDVVSARPPVAHTEISGLARQAHMLLMFERKPSHKGFELLAGAKLFGYLKAGRPIFGVIPPEGEAARVLRDVGVSTIADANSPTHICGELERMLNIWSSGQLASLVPDRPACERYSGEAQTAALVRALEGLPATKPFMPGIVDIVPSLRAEFASEGRA